MSWPRVIQMGQPRFVLPTAGYDLDDDVITYRVEWPPLRIVLDGLVPTLTFPC